MPAAIRSRAQACTHRLWTQSIGLRPAKPGADVVPLLDRLFANVPAQLNLVAVANGREVEQAALWILDLDAELQRAR